MAWQQLIQVRCRCRSWPEGHKDIDHVQPLVARHPGLRLSRLFSGTSVCLLCFPLYNRSMISSTGQESGSPGYQDVQSIEEDMRDLLSASHRDIVDPM